MTRCAVAVLGRFEVSVDGVPIPREAWRGRRPADLVKLLALEPSHALHRGRVTAALWPDLGPDAASANLRKALHYARRAMGSDEAVVARDGMLALWDVDVDAETFEAEAEAALSAGDAEGCGAVADRYGGDLLPADRYEDWAAGPRARLHRRYVAVLKAAGRWEEVLALDPTDEEAHRALMRAYFDEGRRREAIRQFERLRDALREFVGVGPDATTIALYERILAMEGDEPVEPSQHAAVLIANGLMRLHMGEMEEAERLAREARQIALDGDLGDELGDAATLLALVSFGTPRWWDSFREEFVASLAQPPELALAVLDSNLCFAEYYLSGTDDVAAAESYARDLLARADAAGSAPGRSVARVMIGESHLLRGRFDDARAELKRAAAEARSAAAPSALSLSTEHLARAEIASGHRRRAAGLLTRARPAAERSALRSHLVVRLLGVEVETAPDPRSAKRVVDRAERTLSDAPRVCEPCSLRYRVHAVIALARTGELARARRLLESAERVAGMWPGGPSGATVWEARAAIRQAEGRPAQAAALLLEAADVYEGADRRVDAERCRAAAANT
jgi:DNA-binding SARP family transcriptional activator